MLQEFCDTFKIPLTGPEYVKDELFRDLLSEMGAFNAPTNSLEKLEDGFCLHIDLPGVPKQDIDMEVKEDCVVVKAERKGFRATQYSKSYQLPKNTDMTGIEASHKDGVLKILLPQAEKVKVEIKFK